jgi:hypothetical protein
MRSDSRNKAVQRAGGDRLEIIGAIEPGRAVEIGRADRLQPADSGPGAFSDPIEHQMFVQVREAGLALGLVARADMIPDADGDQRHLAIGMNDYPQAIGKRELFVRNLDLGDER